MTARSTIAILSVLSAACLTPAAMAANWVPASGQDADTPSVIFAETDTGAAMLACGADGKMIAATSDNATDFEDRMNRRVAYRRNADVNITVGDTDKGESEWKYMPGIDTLVARRHAQAAKLFNATLKQEDVSITLDDKPFVTLALPEVNPAFTAFAKTCQSNRKN